MKMNIEKELSIGKIVRHKGERKVIKKTYRDHKGLFVVEFVDNSKCFNLQDIELDGRR